MAHVITAVLVIGYYTGLGWLLGGVIGHYTSLGWFLGGVIGLGGGGALAALALWILAPALRIAAGPHQPADGRGWLRRPRPQPGIGSGRALSGAPAGAWPAV